MYRKLWQRLAQQYGEDEAKAIVRMVLEVRFGLSWPDIVCGNTPELSTNDLSALETIIRRLEQSEPVQYVLGQAEFGGRTFMVNHNVLIPRPETYELCQWVLEAVRSINDDEHGVSLLDVGTGSGCIACTLAAELPDAKVTAWDISADALAVARENARRLGVDVSFSQTDILNSHSSSLISHFSFIISNPPYICNKERSTMERNVLDYEPDLALFVPDDDPLLFYRSIAQYALQALQPDGWLYFEINPFYAEPLCEMLRDMRFSRIELKIDQYGKQRFVRARKQ